MVCPSCGAEATDGEAAFCSRCGAMLSEPRRSRRRWRGPRPLPNLPIVELADALRRSFSIEGWLDACRAACVAWIAALCVGALLVTAAKLGSPSLGTGANPISILTAIVILAVASLGSPIKVAGVEVTVLPLGGLAVLGAAIAWAAAHATVLRGATGSRERVFEGAKIGVPFALLAWGSALVFRFRSPTIPVAAGAGEALVFGGAWGCLFGALGGWSARGSARRRSGVLLAELRARSPTGYEGLVAGGVMLLVAVVAASAAGLVWALVSVVRGAAARPLGPADLVAAVIFVLAFLPNLVVAVLSVALGASVDVGARVLLQGRNLGPLREFSLADWGGAPTPWYLWLLVLVPLFACLLGGFAARRNASAPARAVEVLGVAALAFALSLSVVAALSRARLGAGLLQARGFAAVAPDAWGTFFWALLWAGVAGFAGWRVGDAQQRADRPPPSRGETG